MTPIWCTAPAGQAQCTNIEDLSISPLGGRQLELLITITQQPPSCFIHCIHTLNISNRHQFVIYTSADTLRTFTRCGGLKSVKQHSLRDSTIFKSTWRKGGKVVSCVVSKCITSTINSKLMTAIMELIVFSACLKCGETEGWLSWGLESLLSTPTINKEDLACVCLHENAQIVGRGREQQRALDS